MGTLDSNLNVLYDIDALITLNYRPLSTSFAAGSQAGNRLEGTVQETHLFDHLEPRILSFISQKVNIRP